MKTTVQTIIEQIRAARDADAARIAELEAALAAATDPQTLDRTTESALAAMRASLARLVEEAAAARAETDALRATIADVRHDVQASSTAVRCACGRRIVVDVHPQADLAAGEEVWP